MIPLTIDPELRDLIPVLSTEELAELKASVMSEGIRDKLVVWDRGGELVLVDGHHRLALATELDLPYEVHKKEFVDKQAAAEWMIKNQKARRNLNEEQRFNMAEKFRLILESKARENLSLTGGDKKSQSAKSGLLKSTKPIDKPVNTREELAKIADMSQDRYYKIGKVKDTAPASIVEAWRNQEMPISVAYDLTKELDKLPATDKPSAAVLCGLNLEKARKLVSLFETSGKDGSNDTYHEILNSGGIAYGDEMDLFCDFKDSDMAQIGKALASVADYHRYLKRQADSAIENQARLEALEVKSNIVLHEGAMQDVLASLDICFDTVVADPPYNVTGWKWDKLGTSDEFMQTVGVWIDSILACVKEEYLLFWFCSPSYMADTEMLFRQRNMTIQSRLIWNRRNMAKGSDAKYKFIDTWECIFHVGNKPLNFGKSWDDSRFDVQEFAVPQTNFTDAKLHPTQKPLALIEWLLHYGSYDNDLILDPFGGSGTTGEAIQNLAGNRKGHLIEMNEEYCRVIQKRLGL